MKALSFCEHATLSRWALAFLGISIFGVFVPSPIVAQDSPGAVVQGRIVDDA
jgi:hypothetical protein